MKKFIVLLILLMPLLSRAQDSGVKFEKTPSWETICAEAKKANKYIFVYCYSTSNDVCKAISINTFPKKEAGDFFNEHFINVEVQMDRTSTDNESVKQWYAIAKSLTDSYNVDQYPTFLFFDPNGKAVHRVAGNIGNATTFIAWINATVFDPNKQYYTIKEQWKQHLRDSIFLLNAMNVMLNTHDNVTAKQVGEAYFSGLNKPITEDNVKLLVSSADKIITSSNDIIFKLIVDSAQRINIVMKNDYAPYILHNVILNETIGSNRVIRWDDISNKAQQAYPALGKTLVIYLEREFKAKIEHDINDLIYSGNSGTVDWDGILKKLKLKYPGYDNNLGQMLLVTKASYYSQKKEWNTCGQAVYELMQRYGDNIQGATMNDYVWDYLVLHNSDHKILLEAGKWMKRAVDAAPDMTTFMDTYANLLYKTGGNYQQALAMEQKAIDVIKVSDSAFKDGYQKEFEAALDKMKKRLPTWEDNTPVPDTDH